MKLTRATVQALLDAGDGLDDAWSEFAEAAEEWCDSEIARDERSYSREDVADAIEGLRSLIDAVVASLP